jgi:hypothetical protein
MEPSGVKVRDIGGSGGSPLANLEDRCQLQGKEVPDALEVKTSAATLFHPYPLDIC